MVDLSVRFQESKDLNLNHRVELLNHRSGRSLFLSGEGRVREDNRTELFSRQIGSKLGSTKAVIVAEVTVEASHVCREFDPFFTRDSSFSRGFLKDEEVSVSEVGLEDQKERRCFITALVEAHLSSSPRSLAHKISVVFLLLGEVTPSSFEV